MLDMDYINSLPQPFLGISLGGSIWPIFDIEADRGLVRIDVCGQLDVLDIADFSFIQDAYGVKRRIDAFYSDAIPEEREPVLSGDENEQ